MNTGNRDPITRQAPPVAGAGQDRRPIRFLPSRGGLSRHPPHACDAQGRRPCAPFQPTLIWILRGCSSARFGTLRVSTPSCIWASIWSACSSWLKVKLRLN